MWEVWVGATHMGTVQGWRNARWQLLKFIKHHAYYNHPEVREVYGRLLDAEYNRPFSCVQDAMSVRIVKYGV